MFKMARLCKKKLDDQIKFFLKKYTIPIYNDILEGEECIFHPKSLFGIVVIVVF